MKGRSKKYYRKIFRAYPDMVLGSKGACSRAGLCKMGELL